MFCPKCGSSVNENSKFCGVCGTPIEKKVIPTSIVVEPKKKKGNIIPFILIVLLVIGGGIFVTSKMDLSQLNFINKDNQDAEVDSDDEHHTDVDNNDNQQVIDDDEKEDNTQSDNGVQDDEKSIHDTGVTQLDENGYIINTVGFPNNCTIHEISLEQLDSICNDSIIEASWDGKFIKVTGEFWYQLHLETGTHSTYICDTINAIEFYSCGLITEKTLNNLDGFYIPIEIIGRIEKDNPITLQPYVIRLNGMEMSLVR